MREPGTRSAPWILWLPGEASSQIIQEAGAFIPFFLVALIEIIFYLFQNKKKFKTIEHLLTEKKIIQRRAHNYLWTNTEIGAVLQ